MSTTTSGRAYNNPYVPSTGAAPVIPASPTTLTTTVQAWTAQTGVDIHLRRAVITGSSMGNNGGFRARYKIGSASGSAGSKTVKVFFGGSIIQQPPDLASQAGLNTEVELQNRGAPNVNLRTGTLMTVFGNVAMANTTFDTSVNQALDLKVNLALATDYIISEGWTVEVRPF